MRVQRYTVLVIFEKSLKIALIFYYKTAKITNEGARICNAVQLKLF